MRRLNKLLFVLLLTLGASATGYAQESIFVPLENEADNAAQTQTNSADAAERWITLQNDLYRIVLTFDDQAKQLERVLLSNDEARIHNHVVRLRAKTEGREPNEDGRYSGEKGIVHSMLCRDLDASLDRYIAKNTPELEKVVQELTKRTMSMSESDKAEFSTKMRVAIAGNATEKRAKEILYLCLYKYKNEGGQPTPWAVDKTLKKWFMVQMPLLDAWVGNVD